MNDIPLKQVIDASLENIKKVLDADAVVGTPISLPDGVTIIPISKVSCGFTSGGVDFDSKTNPRRDTPHFGGGNAAGMSVTPMTFLVVSGGEVRVMNVNGTSVTSDSAIVNTISDLVDKSPAIFEKVKSYFKKDAKKPSKQEAEAPVDVSVASDEPEALAE